MKDLLNRYKIEYNIFSDIDYRLICIKPRIDALTEGEQIILYLYAELGSYRKVGKALGFSHNTAGRLINEIKDKILCY